MKNRAINSTEWNLARKPSTKVDSATKVQNALNVSSQGPSTAPFATKKFNYTSALYTKHAGIVPMQTVWTKKILESFYNNVALFALKNFDFVH